MQRPAANLRSFAFCAVLGALASLSGCGSKEPPAEAAAPPAATPPATQPAGAPADVAPVTAAEVTRTWTPEALEELLAPVALYPDPVLSQLLIASTNPQEVLDAGNWLLQNDGLKGKALDDAAAKIGFTPPIRALVQFPETVDMMCLELGWTTELGEAFVADQAGVLDAIQRLRTQAIDAGNLQSSPQMTVETTEQDGKDVVLLKPAEPEVVYVPQYDPVTAYAPASTTTTAAVPATTTTTTVEEKGHSTGTLIATGVLAFGAGILVNELFDDDDDDWDHHDYYYPNYGYGGMPYYPPYPYRPAYGGGYYPSNGYNRPPNYNSGWQNNGNIIINTGDRPSGGYWDRYDNKAGARPYQRPASSPITAARPNRPELQQLNTRQARPMPADVKRPSADATASNWKGQSSYAGADKKSRDKMSSQERIANAQPGYSKPAAGKAGTRDAQKPAPKVQGSYAGAKYDRPTPADVSRPDKGTRDVQKPTPATRDVAKPAKAQGDRGYAKPDARPAQRPQQAQRPAPRPESKPSPKPSSRPAPSGSDRTAVSGGRTGQSERAASQRGKQSMPQGARSKGGGGGGGGQKKKR
jgi:predicted small lipoprotein YifL